MKRPEESGDRGVLDRGFDLAENAVYVLLAVLLVAAAGVLLVESAHRLVTHVGDDALDAVKLTLDSLLLVFVLVELLSAIRATVRERKLVAEPFLLVGMIASIKEIVVTAVDAREYVGGRGDEFADSMTTIAVLSGVLLVLAVSTLLVRRKEREPAE